MIDIKTLHEYEAVLLGQIINNPDLLAKSKLDAVHFTKDLHKEIFKAVIEIVNDGLEPNLIILNERTGSRYSAYLAKITSIPTDANFEYYQQHLITYYNFKQFENLMAKIQTKLRSSELSTLIQEVYHGLEDIQTETNIYKVQSIREALLETVEEIEVRVLKDRETLEMKTGINGLDKYLIGDARQRLYYIGGRPSEGKTTLLLNIAIHQAKLGRTIGIISLESGIKELMMRILSFSGNIQAGYIFGGILGKQSLDKLMATSNRLAELKIYFYDEPNLILNQVLSKIRYFVTVLHCDIIMIDYLQLIYAPHLGLERREEVAYISKTLKDYARRFNIPIVATAQLRRDADGRRPRLSDFQESSQIEKDADVAILIYNMKKEGSEPGEYKLNEWFLCLDKNRDGATKMINVEFNKEYQRFEDKEKAPSGA